MTVRIAIVGGGVAGLTVAHELSKEGAGDFEIVVFDRNGEPGGKARSMDVPGTASGGRRALPGEHGFRFFPGFYQHVPETMGEIPVGGGRTVLDNLVGANEFQIAREGGSRELISPAHFPESLRDLQRSLDFLRQYAAHVGIPVHEFSYFAERLLLLLTSSDERRFEEYEHLSWWEFSGAERRSEAYGKFLADGLTRSLVAARARELSARTGGLILLQLMFDMSRSGRRVDRVLNGPTNDVWIEPWLRLLESRGVDYRRGHDVQAIYFADGRISGLVVESDGRLETVTADHYVAAVPVEQMTRLVSEPIRWADPQLAQLPRLEIRWMNGIMFYLDRDTPLVHGHTIYIDSRWSLTSISQQQFWPVDLETMGDGRVEGILSVDVSEWRRAAPARSGRPGKPAVECTAEEIKDEVWAQLEDHLNDREVEQLNRANVLRWFLDPAVEFHPGSEATNSERLLVNTVGSWDFRPDATPRERRDRSGRAIANLFLASDYVRTFTDLATMEAANEAGRRAVNGILEVTGSERRCRVARLTEPSIFRIPRAIDRLRFKLRRPAKKRVEVEDGEVRPANRLDAAMLRR